jgi:hypothetical protein
MDVPPHPTNLFLASFEQFKYDVGTRFEDQYAILEELAASVAAVHRSVGEVYRIVRKKKLCRTVYVIMLNGFIMCSVVNVIIIRIRDEVFDC